VYLGLCPTVYSTTLWQLFHSCHPLSGTNELQWSVKVFSSFSYIMHANSSKMGPIFEYETRLVTIRPSGFSTQQNGFVFSLCVGSILLSMSVCWPSPLQNAYQLTKLRRILCELYSVTTILNCPSSCLLFAIRRLSPETETSCFALGPSD
jgi:hypothetical protein